MNTSAGGSTLVAGRGGGLIDCERSSFFFQSQARRVKIENYERGGEIGAEKRKNARSLSRPNV